MSVGNAENGAVLVLGGSGFYGRYLVDDLLEHTTARVVVASRNPSRDRAWRSRVATAVCDVVIHCAGPFQYLPLAPVHAAIATGTPCVDIAEDRHFAREVRSAPRSGRRAPPSSEVSPWRRRWSRHAWTPSHLSALSQRPTPGSTGDRPCST